MRIHSKALAVGLLATLGGCGAAIPWEAACGCGPLWWFVAEDLGFTSAIGEKNMSPDFIALATEERLVGKDLTLATVRGLGPDFDAACIRRGLAEISCTFWMWSFEEQNRGIELRFSDFADDGAIRVTGRYVYDSNPNRG